jgi:hypothetical protein
MQEFSEAKHPQSGSDTTSQMHAISSLCAAMIGTRQYQWDAELQKS